MKKPDTILPHLQSLFKKYGRKKHPLNYSNTYQLVVMVVLSAQTTDAAVNKLAPDLFRRTPSFPDLAAMRPEELYPFIKTVRGYRKKAEWLVQIAQAIGDEKNIPLLQSELTKLPGIGRKSANVIIREAGGEPQGIIVDLHVLRVVPRIGITAETNPVKMEKVLMDFIPKKYWNTAGMSFSHLGRELCRPTNPRCAVCCINTICEYHRNAE
ncbi:MAG: endonuclease III [Ignavibacteriae bacterium]|nr:MAG: endonuclease III [Ignavibacteriota bacterium]